MTKEQLEKKVKELETALEARGIKISQLEEAEYYVRQCERSYLYGEIHSFVRDYLINGGEIILRPRRAEEGCE